MEREPRPSWAELWFRVAFEAAKRATCDRLHVGCVIVDEGNRLISLGYNGALEEMPHCDDVGHDIVEGHCVRAAHAEENAVDFATRPLAGSTVYVTGTPCWPCFRRLAKHRVATVFYAREYRHDPRIDEVARAYGIRLEHWPQLWNDDEAQPLSTQAA